MEYNSRKLTSNDQTIDLFEHKYKMVLFEINPLFEFFIFNEYITLSTKFIKIQKFNYIYKYLVTQVSATRNVEYNSRKLSLTIKRSTYLVEQKYKMVLFETNPLFESTVTNYLTVEVTN